LEAETAVTQDLPADIARGLDLDAGVRHLERTPVPMLIR
jgi:hypothetical protein